MRRNKRFIKSLKVKTACINVKACTATCAGRDYKLFYISFLRSTGSLAPISKVNRFYSLFFYSGSGLTSIFERNHYPTISGKRIETRVRRGMTDVVTVSEEIAMNRKMFAAINAIVEKNGVFGRINSD